MGLHSLLPLFLSSRFKILLCFNFRIFLCTLHDTVARSFQVQEIPLLLSEHESLYRYSLSSAHAYERLSHVLKDPAISSRIAFGIKTTGKHNLAVAGHLFSSNHSSTLRISSCRKTFQALSAMLFIKCWLSLVGISMLNIYRQASQSLDAFTLFLYYSHLLPNFVFWPLFICSPSS